MKFFANSAGYPFSTFGEIVACWVQDVMLVALVLFYRCANPELEVDKPLCHWE